MLDPLRDQFAHSPVVIISPVAPLRGMLVHALGRYDDAVRSFAQGDAMNQRLRSPMLIADGHAHSADMLADRNRPGDRERARELATGARPLATEGGYGYTACSTVWQAAQRRGVAGARPEAEMIPEARD